MLLGGDRELLQETITQVGGFGTFLTADVLRLALESKQIPELVKNTPGYVYVYDYDPTQTVAGRSVFTNRVELAANITKNNYTLTEDSKGNLYYAKVIRLADGNENIGYVAVPGGGNTVGDRNDLIIIKTNNSEGGYGAGGSVWGEKTSFKLTVDQLIGKATLSIGTALQEGLLNGQSIARWASTKGPDFYKSIKLVTVGGSIILADKKLREYAREIFDDGIDSKNARASIQKWLQDNKGISDAVFNVTDSILASGLIANGDQGWTLRVKNDAGGFDVYFNSIDDTQDNLPPAPEGSGAGAFASTDPSFGIKPDQKPTPNMPAVMPTRPGAPGAVRPGAQGGMPVTQNFIPTSDLLEHTLRNIGPSIRPSGPTVSPEIAPGVRPPSGPQPTIGIYGERGSGPQARGISIAPTPPSGGPATIKRDVRFGRRAI
jgi:hypothetical protein